LAEVLAEVHRRTGADITMPPGAGQEPIIADLGPAPAREVMATLLNGSPFNFVMVGSDNDPSQLRGIFLTLRQGAGGDNPVTYPAVVVGQQQPGPDQAMAPPDNNENPPEAAPNPEPDMAPNQPQQRHIGPYDETVEWRDQQQ